MQPHVFKEQLRRRLNGVIAMVCPGSSRPLGQVRRTLQSIARAVGNQEVVEQAEADRVERMKLKAGAT